MERAPKDTPEDEGSASTEPPKKEPAAPVVIPDDVSIQNKE